MDIKKIEIFLTMYRYDLQYILYMKTVVQKHLSLVGPVGLLDYPIRQVRGRDILFQHCDIHCEGIFLVTKHLIKKIFFFSDIFQPPLS